MNKERNKIEKEIGNQIPGQMEGDLEQTNRLTYCEKREKVGKISSRKQKHEQKKINSICERCI